MMRCPCWHAAHAGAPRLYDLVRIKDDKLRPAFFYAMGNTLVAK
jgi:structural maintenance of chromosome 4